MSIKRFSASVAMALALFTFAASANAANVMVLWTFGSGASPDLTPTVDNVVGTPTIAQAGVDITATGATGTALYTDADNINYGAGKDISWASGVNGPPANSFSVTFNATGFSNYFLRWDYRSTATGSPGDTLTYDIGGGPVAIGPHTYTTDAAFHEVLLDLSSFDPIDGAASVTFTWTFSTAGTGSGTTGIDNVQLSSIVPEPAALSLLGLVSLVTLRRRK